jgi:SepF-like predicted cell division protein (DUF552 family)
VEELPSFGGLLRRPKRGVKTTEAEQGPGKTYLKAMPLRELSDLDSVKAEVNSGNILILRITPLANKNVDDVKRAVDELSDFAQSVGGDIARLGEERVVVCPRDVKIWREKTSVSKEPMSTAA